jgi:hypothetical protein
VIGFRFLVGAVVVLTLLPGCGAPPTEPAGTECVGVKLSTDMCDSSGPFPTGSNLPDLPCPTRSEIDEIRRDIPVSVVIDVSAGVLTCRERDGSVDLTVVENNIYQSLIFLRRMRFDRPVPWTSLPVYDWVRETIPLGIVIESSGSSHSCLRCQGPIHVVYSSYDQLRPTIHHLVSSLIVHESRHAEGWPHTCGPSSGPFHPFEQDKSVAELGAFGVQYLLRYWLGHYSNESEEVREYFRRRAALTLGGSAFCCECGARTTPLPAVAALRGPHVDARCEALGRALAAGT